MEEKHKDLFFISKKKNHIFKIMLLFETLMQTHCARLQYITKSKILKDTHTEKTIYAHTLLLLKFFRI